MNKCSFFYTALLVLQIQNIDTAPIKEHSHPTNFCLSSPLAQFVAGNVSRGTFAATFCENVKAISQEDGNNPNSREAPMFQGLSNLNEIRFYRSILAGQIDNARFFLGQFEIEHRRATLKVTR